MQPRDAQTTSLAGARFLSPYARDAFAKWMGLAVLASITVVLQLNLQAQ